MTRPNLTKHQRETYKTLVRWSNRMADGWVGGDFLGSAGALAHLERKGYIERHTYTGPRGGAHHMYRPRDLQANDSQRSHPTRGQP